MKQTPNISYTTRHQLCTGCGVCEGACPSNAITTVVKNGQFVPVIDAAACINEKGCHRCYDACPGVGVRLNEIANASFDAPETKSDEKIGRYIACATGYSTDYDIRYHAASGGMLSQFMIWLLEKKYIDGAVVTKFSTDNELLVESFIATTKEEVLAAKSSKYAPVTLNRAIQDIKKREGHFVIVGLPCHIHGFRKYEKLDKKFKEKVIGYFGLYCSGGRTFYLTEHVFKERNIQKEELTYFAYRDEGCLGSLVANGISSSTLKPFRDAERFQQYYHPLRSFFKPRRCLQCIDHFAELADVSFGDIHVKPYIQDKVGVNSVVIRNPQFLQWLKEAEADGCLEMQVLDAKILLKSQRIINHKKRRPATFMKLDKCIGRKVPHYDVELKDDSSLKSAISYLHTMMQIFIGKHKSLWFVIPFLKQKPPVE